MERAARCRSGKAARVGLLTLGLVGCAAVRNPPGGPPDFAAPVLLGVTPDSGTINPGFNDEITFSFDEVIEEGAQGGLERYIRLSPRGTGARVAWHRSNIGVRPRDGWRANTIYHVTLDSGIADLSRNPSSEARTIVFSTGGEIPATTMTGTVLDWEVGSLARNALIEALFLPDSLLYVTRADSNGQFRFDALPPGDYAVYAAVDGNGNGFFDRREAFDSTLATLDSTLSTDLLWAFVHDTTGPRLRGVTYVDTVTASLEFSQSLLPGDPALSDVSLQLLPDSTPVAIAAVYLESTYDSIVALARAAADSARRDSLAALDTAAVDSAAAPVLVADTTATPAPEVSLLDRLLDLRPPLERRWVVVTVEPMQPGSRYVISATASNFNEAIGEARSVLITPDPEPPPPEPEIDPEIDPEPTPPDSTVG